MQYNYKLHRAIRENRLYQKDFAKLVGSNDTKVSQVINGRYLLTPTEKLQWSRALNRKREEVFDE